MTLQELGSVGELVGGLGVVFSLVYVAFQVRQNSKQIQQNSRHLEASMYHASGEGFNRWWSLIAQDEAVASLWQRGVAGEVLNQSERFRFNSMALMLFTVLENNFHQLQLGSHNRDTMGISRAKWVALLATPGGGEWWRRDARDSFTPEFVDAVEALIGKNQPGSPARSD
jgi:hypothetical protein